MIHAGEVQATGTACSDLNTWPLGVIWLLKWVRYVSISLPSNITLLKPWSNTNYSVLSIVSHIALFHMNFMFISTKYSDMIYIMYGSWIQSAGNTIWNKWGWREHVTCGCISQVNPDFEEESAEQRSSVSQSDLLLFECLCWLTNRYLICPILCWIFAFCYRWRTLHPLISRSDNLYLAAAT